jgi:outer membrane immunogenic protein
MPVASGILLYAKGGYSNMELRLDYEDFEDIIDDFSESENVDGVHAGVGVEIAAGPNVYLKGEYVYTMYNGSEETIDGSVFAADIDRQQASVGVGFRF